VTRGAAGLTAEADAGTSAPLPLDVDADIAAFLAEVDRRLQPHFHRVLARLPRVAPLRTGVAHQLTTGGKRIRAALCVASCELFGTPFVCGLEFAAAIEHIHNFTLVHDDIADGDAERRAHPSMWKQHGIAHAINIGDVFVPLAAQSILEAAYQDAVKLQLLALTARYALEMVEGQNLDLNLRANDAAGYEDYLECASKKTGAFLALATVGGGLVGGAAPKDLERLREFARLSGVSFQIRDDLLDMDGDKGRPRGSDVLEGKRTLMVIHAAHRATAVERRRLYGILNKSRRATSAADVAWVWTLFRATGADEYAAGRASDFIDQACGHVLDLPESAAKYRLLRLARYLCARRR
jgi:geranylgeranyl diphosphate synthase, type I